MGRVLFSAVPAGLVVLSNPTKDLRPGLSSAVPAGLSLAACGASGAYPQNRTVPES
jgi:hypothetical protein